MALAIFDLDNTLLDGDSDYLWGQFLASEGIVDGEHYERENERYYREYQDGTLDISEFLRFSLRPLRDNPRATMEALRARFVAEIIEPIMLDAALTLVERHRAAADTLLIITATNGFVGAPIAERFGIPHIIATNPEEREGRYTGDVTGVPSFREGKVIRLEEWLSARGESLDGSHFYSDSHNDIPLLERVSHPFAVDPDDQLREEALARGWPIISLRA